MKVETDRELLELAAKAAGIKLGNYVESIDDYYSEWNGADAFELDGGGYWNPLTDGGDALRMAVKLTMMVDFITEPLPMYMSGHVVAASKSGLFYEPGFTEEATRRAIVRAAAEIGKSMQ